VLSRQSYHDAVNRPKWVWNGRAVSITDFAELAFGDTPAKTLFLLKYSDKEK